MDVIYGYDKGTKENTLTLFLTEQDTLDYMNEEQTIDEVLVRFWEHCQVGGIYGNSSVDGENGDVMIRR